MPWTSPNPNPDTLSWTPDRTAIINLVSPPNSGPDLDPKVNPSLETSLAELGRSMVYQVPPQSLAPSP